jgi:hypothetical protein
MGITAYRRVGDQLLPWNAIAAAAFGEAGVECAAWDAQASVGG